MTIVDRDTDGPSALSIAQREMRSGERLIWADRPAPGSLALAVLPPTLFVLSLAGFAVFRMAMAKGMTSETEGVFSIFQLFSLPFLFLGLGLMLVPVWTWMGAKKTVYAVSSDRLVIIKGGSVRSFAPDEIENVERRERPDGSGDVIFRRDHVRTQSRRGSRTRTRRDGFFGIPDVTRVEDQIRTLKERVRD